MATVKIQSLNDLAEEMKAVARGDEAPPADAAIVSFESADAFSRLLTPESLELLHFLQDQKRE